VNKKIFLLPNSYNANKHNLIFIIVFVVYSKCINENINTKIIHLMNEK